MSAIQARRGSLGTRRFSGLGMPKSTSPDADPPLGKEGELAPDSTVGGVGDGGGGTGTIVAVEEASGHFFVGFGRGLTTKSPVVYFTKTKHTGGDDCKAPISAHKARTGSREGHAWELVSG